MFDSTVGIPQVIHKMVLSRVLNLDSPMPISQTSSPSYPSLFPYPCIHFLSESTVWLQILWHGLENLPPPLVGWVTSKLMVIQLVPITIIVLVTHPWLQPQILHRITILCYLMLLIARPIENFELIKLCRQPVPPCKSFIKKSLFTTIIWLQLETLRQ